MSSEVAEPTINLDRDTALKIALAAKVIPNITAGTLIDILQKILEGNITSKRLKKITITDLKTGIANAEAKEVGDAELESIKEAVKTLWGDADVNNLPTIEEPLATDDQTVVHVAVASNTAEKLDGHFGSCIHFLVYELSTTDLRLVDVRSTMETDLAEDKNLARAALISDCDVVYVQSIGGPAAAKVVRAGIYPIKIKAGGGEGTARELLLKLQQVMQINPPPWLAKIMGIEAEARVRFERSEEEG